MVSKQLLSTLAIAVSATSYFPYLWSIAKGRTKPHAFSWAVWGLLTGVAYLAQISEEAGPRRLGHWLYRRYLPVHCSISLPVGRAEDRRQRLDKFHCSAVRTSTVVLHQTAFGCCDLGIGD
jgi:hypothetical protein